MQQADLGKVHSRVADRIPDIVRKMYIVTGVRKHAIMVELWIHVSKDRDVTQAEDVQSCSLR